MEGPLVYKFGGAVLRSPEGFAAMAQRLRECPEQRPVVVVISALGRTTRELEEAAADAERGEQERAFARLCRLVETHRQYAEALLSSQRRQELENFLAETRAHLQGYLEGVRITGELTPRTLDMIRSYGEQWALAMVLAFLQEHGFRVAAVEATELLCTDARHGMAQLLVEQTAARVEQYLRPLLRPGQCVVTQGFVARSVRGDITTMGQESSMLTAVVLAGLIGAEEVVLWTDVPGIRACDPTVVPDAGLLPTLSYAQARQIAHAGLRLLYPAAITLAERWGIRLRFRSAFAPGAGETVVSSTAGELVPMIVGREQVRLVIGSSAEVETTLRLSPVDGSAILARWEDAEELWAVVSSDIPGAHAVATGAVVTVFASGPQHMSRLFRICGQLLAAGQLLRVWYVGQLRCFVQEGCYGEVLRALWQELRG